MLLGKIAAAAAALLVAAAAAAQLPADYSPPPPLAPENAWHLDLSTGGRVTVQLRPDVAPAHVERIRTLTRMGFYDNVVFHRVIEGFMAQGGDPTGTGTGGSPLPDVAAEFNGLPHLRGAVAMARTQEPNSANSQFYIMLAPRFSLDRQYTVFGRVVAGMAHVDSIERGEPPANPSRIVRAWIGSPDAGPPAVGQIRAEPAQTQAEPPSAAPPPPREPR